MDQSSGAPSVFQVKCIALDQANGSSPKMRIDGDLGFVPTIHVRFMILVQVLLLIYEFPREWACKFQAEHFPSTKLTFTIMTTQ